MDRLAILALAVERDPAQAARDAADLADQAESTADWGTVSRAHAIRGRSLLMLGEIALAEHALRASVAAGERADDDDDNGALADAHLALAGVLSASGRHDEAFASLDQVDRLGSPSTSGRALLQRAAVCRDVRRHDEALRLFHEAIPGLRRDGRDLDLARVLANCGGILIYQGRIDDAIVSLEEAAALFRATGQEFIALHVLHDLGCAAAHQGDLPQALRLFDEASRGMAALGHDASLPVLSRAEALLRSGLSADALDVAREAARRLGGEGHAFTAAQALLTVAESARLEDALDLALDAAGRAAAAFAAGGADGWERAATIEMMRTRLALGTIDDSAVDQLTSLADALGSTGDLGTEMNARCLAAVAAASIGRLADAQDQLDAATALAGRTRLEQHDTALAHARAATHLAAGQLEDARRALHAAFDSVAVATRIYGTADANPALGTDGRAVAGLALRVAAAEPDATRALDWMERVRAITGPAARASGFGAAGDFSALRAITGELRRAEREGVPTDELRAHQSQLEAAMRARWMESAGARGDVAVAAFDPDQLSAAIGDAVVVSVATVGDDTFAVVVTGECARRVELGSTASVLAVADRAAAALRSAGAHGAPAVVASRRRAFDAAIRELDEALLTPLRLEAPEVVLALPGALHGVPWAATRTLAASPFTLVPSVAWWIAARATPVVAPTSALVVAGPRLAAAESEAAAVAACHPTATKLVGDAATVGATIAAMGDHDVAHLVAHGRFRHDNPMWSTIELSDGVLTVYELQGLERVPPTVVVATCESAASGGRSGADLLGLSGTLLAMGTRTMVASVGALPDDAATLDAMRALHRDLTTGIGAAESLARRRTETGRDGHDGLDLSQAALVTLGLGTARS